MGLMYSLVQNEVQVMTIDKLKRNTRKWAVSVSRIIFLLAFSFILIYPIIFMISNSVKTQSDTMSPAVKWISRNPSFYSFKIAIKALDFWKSLKNTFLFEIISGMIEVFTCAFYAYGIARFKMRLKPLMMGLLVLIIFIPDIILIIPRIINFRYMDFLGILGLIKDLAGKDLRPNLIDTPFMFWLPSLFGVGLKGGIFMFIYIQFFKGLPVELEEAAWIDGAGVYRTFFSIIMPSSGVVILTVFIFSILWHWNDWLLAMMYTSQENTLATLLYDIDQVVFNWSQSTGIRLDTELSYGISLAACLIFIAPPLVMYMFLQKKFIQSVDRVGIVG